MAMERFRAPAFASAALAVLLVSFARPCGAQAWETEDAAGAPEARNEACMAYVGGKAYLIGGRSANRKRVHKMVSEYDLATKTWTNKTRAPAEINHIQCAVYSNRIWIAGGYYGVYPQEKQHEEMYIYDPANDKWTTRAFLPDQPERRRSAAAFVFDSGSSLFYLSHGTQGGHGVGSKVVGYIDVYDPVADKWNPSGSLLPDAPHPRGHTAGAVVEGKVCVASGRDDSVRSFFSTPVLETDCFDIATSSWTTEASIPHGRVRSTARRFSRARGATRPAPTDSLAPRPSPHAQGGAAIGTNCDGEMMVVGGEGSRSAFAWTDLFKPSWKAWKLGPSLQQARHGTGLAVAECGCGTEKGWVYIASGNGAQGGGMVLTSTERVQLGAGACPDAAAPDS
jgi:Kelch motif